MEKGNWRGEFLARIGIGRLPTRSGSNLLKAQSGDIDGRLLKFPSGACLTWLK